MKIASWNVNGIRAVERKGDLDVFLQRCRPDILFLQEIKATPEKLSTEMTAHPDFLQFYHPAEKPGYAGTGVWVSKKIPMEVTFVTGMDGFEDTEGRISRIDLGEWTILGIYFPNGGKSEDAWHGKLVFYEHFLRHIDTLRKNGRQVIWCGDVNCAHEPIDLARPKENMESIGFLPEEREWVSKVIDHSWEDSFRSRNPDTVVYSWWHVLSGARSRNIGWRIDYFFVDSKFSNLISGITYLTAQMGSDHCPVLLDIKMQF